MRQWIAWLLARIVYRLRIVGRENLPATGPVLLVSNHVSYVDWLVIMAASPRPVRFVIDQYFLKNRWFGWVLRASRVIPIRRGVGPKSLMKSFEAVQQALADGDVVCVFPEGYPTRNGIMLPFRRGFEFIAKAEAVPVVPVYLDRLWGSIFSYKRGRLFWKWPERGWRPVTVAFGRPRPNTIQAHEARQAIEEMAAAVTTARTRTILPVHRQFVRSAARHPFQPCLIDTTADPPRTLSRGKVLAGAVCLARWLRPQFGDDPMVGVWLPSSVPAAVLNLALSLLGRTPVNLNYTAGMDNVRSAARQCGIRRVITSRRFTARMALDLGPDVELVYLEDARTSITKAQQVRAFLRTVLLPGRLHDLILGLGRHTAADLNTVIFSSGSTGEPKGVMLTHQNIAANVDAFIDHVDFSSADHVLGILPFFHSFGYTVTLWGALTAGARIVYHADPRAAKEVGELCHKYG